MDLFHGVILCLLAETGIRMNAERLAQILLTEDVRAIRTCMELISCAPMFELTVSPNSSLSTIRITPGHDYTIQSVFNTFDFEETSHDMAVLRHINLDLRCAQAHCVSPVQASHANVVLDYIVSLRLEEGEIFESDGELTMDDDDDDDENDMMNMRDDAVPTRICTTITNTLNMTPEQIALAGSEFESSMTSLKTAFERSLNYVSLMRQIDRESQVSKREPKSMDCMIENVIDSMDKQLDQLRQVLRTHVGYTPADVNGMCVICQSNAREPVALMCGHILCMKCVWHPGFKKDHQTFLGDNPGVVCPMCKHEGSYIPLFIS